MFDELKKKADQVDAGKREQIATMQGEGMERKPATGQYFGKKQDN